MHIRPVQREDRDQWLAMRKRLWPDDTDAQHLAEIDAIFAGDAPWIAQVVFVAQREDGSLVGFVEVSTRPYADGCVTSPVGYIEGWHVDESSRGQGVGGQLIAAAESWVKQRGLTEVASDCELDNATSYKAHLALGYREVDRVIQFCKRL